MEMKRTTIYIPTTLNDRVLKNADYRNEKLVEFYTRAIINQLENDGDFEIRDIIEREIKNDKEEDF